MRAVTLARHAFYQSTLAPTNEPGCFLLFRRMTRAGPWVLFLKQQVPVTNLAAEWDKTQNWIDGDKEWRRAVFKQRHTRRWEVNARSRQLIFDEFPVHGRGWHGRFDDDSDLERVVPCGLGLRRHDRSGEWRVADRTRQPGQRAFQDWPRVVLDLSTGQLVAGRQHSTVRRT